MHNSVCRFRSLPLIRILLCPVLLLAGAVGSQAQIVPSDADLERIQRHQGTVILPDAQAIEKAGRDMVLPSDEAIQAGASGFADAASDALRDPRLIEPRSAIPKRKYQPASPQEREGYANDLKRARESVTKETLDSVAARYQAHQARELRRLGADIPEVPQDAILVFVSFSMPEQVLRSLAEQAKAVGATLVLRGMKDASLASTKRAASLVNQAGAPWEINPKLFKAFDIKAVPTYVVTGNREVLDSGCPLDENEACSFVNTYASIRGGVSMEIALDTIRRRSEIPYVRQLAEARLDALAKSRQD